MTIMTIVAGVIAGLMLATASSYVIWRKRHPRKLNSAYFQEEWKLLQKLLRDKAKWAEAILDADGLLEEALKKRHIKGRSMGERLVRAQRQLSDNDGVWFGHKLRNKIDADPMAKLKKTDVKQALMGIRQALKDLGALE